jgi:hypothetical protein
MIKDECVFYQQSREYARKNRDMPDDECQGSSREARPESSQPNPDKPKPRASLAEHAEDAELKQNLYVLPVYPRFFPLSLRTLRLCEKISSSFEQNLIV